MCIETECERTCFSIRCFPYTSSSPFASAGTGAGAGCSCSCISHIFFSSVFCCLIICPDNCRYTYTYRSCFSYFAYCVVNERESFELQTAKWKSEKPHYHQKIFPKLTLKTRHVQMYIVHVHSRYTKKDNDTYAHTHTRTHARTHIRTHVCTDMSIDAFKAADEKIAPDSIVLFVFKLFSVNSISILLHGFPFSSCCYHFCSIF